MRENGRYQTRHHAEIENYLSSMPQSHFTVADICDYFRSKGNPIGTTTVYRQIDRMMEEGRVQKYVIDEKTPACFAYVGEESHCDKECFHCKCEKCGKLIHLHCEELSGIKAHLGAHHGFQLNPLKTVFYGVCEACAG